MFWCHRQMGMHDEKNGCTVWLKLTHMVDDTLFAQSYVFMGFCKNCIMNACFEFTHMVDDALFAQSLIFMFFLMV